MLAVGVRSSYKWDALVPFLTEKEQVFLISHGPSLQNTNISFWLVITLLLQWSPNCSSCCEFLVSSLHFVLSPFVLAGVFEDLLKVVFFPSICVEFAGFVEQLSVWVFNVSCGACRGVMLRVLAAVVSCSWRRFLVNWWGEAVLCLRTALP